ncbi:putative membrane protein, partial [Bacteroides fragilis str. 3397 T10]
STYPFSQKIPLFSLFPSFSILFPLLFFLFLLLDLTFC